MTVRQLNSQSFALGLSWLPPADVAAAGNESRRMRDLQKLDPSATCHVEIEGPGGAQTQVAVSTEVRCAGHPAAAAWVAAAQKNAVLVEDLGGGEYWLCAAEDGFVFPAGDLVGTRDQIAARITELRSDLSGTSIPCYDKTQSFGLPGAQPLEFSDLVSGTELLDLWTVSRIQSKRSRLPLIGVAAALCIAAGFGSWHLYRTSLDQSPMEVPEEIALQASLREQERSLIAAELSQNAAQLVNLIVREITTRPHRAAGWRNTEAEWKLDAMQADWERTHGSYSELATHLGSRDFTVDSKSGNVTENYPLPAPTLSPDSDPDFRLSAAPDRYALLDALARLPGRWTLASAQQHGTAYQVYRSAITGEVTGIQAALAATDFFKTLPVHIRSISVRLNPRPEWRFAGDFYAQAN